MSDDPTKLFTMKVKQSKLDEYRRMSKSLRRPLSQIIQRLLDKQCLQTVTRDEAKRARQVDPQLIYQVAAIGNNLNQIARRLNSGERVEVLPHMIATEAKLQELVDAHQVH